MLRTIFISFTAIIWIYSIYTISQHGIWYLPVYFETVFSGDWTGQFTIDFSLYLALSALWIAWRSGFTVTSFVMAGIAAFLGMLVFAPYLMYLHYKTKGDVCALVLGVHKP